MVLDTPGSARQMETNWLDQEPVTLASVRGMAAWRCRRTCSAVESASNNHPAINVREPIAVGDRVPLHRANRPAAMKVYPVKPVNIAWDDKPVPLYTSASMSGDTSIFSLLVPGSTDAGAKVARRDRWSSCRPQAGSVDYERGGG